MKAAICFSDLEKRQKKQKKNNNNKKRSLLIEDQQFFFPIFIKISTKGNEHTHTHTHTHGKIVAIIIFIFDFCLHRILKSVNYLPWQILVQEWLSNSRPYDCLYCAGFVFKRKWVSTGKSKVKREPLGHPRLRSPTLLTFTYIKSKCYVLTFDPAQKMLFQGDAPEGSDTFQWQLGEEISWAEIGR